MASEMVDVLVVGAGVIGLAVARRLALAGQQVMILERGPAFGMETSSRNSEVIHAGIYYAPGSLKAALCIRGKELLYDFCARHAVAHRRCGKLVVATNAAQRADLERIRDNAERAGMNDLHWLSGAQVHGLEPDILCDVALFSPSTGIIDSHGYMLALLGEAEAHGAMLVCHTEIVGVDRVADGWAVRIAGESDPVVTARTIVNCAGLGANALAARMEGLEAAHVPELRFAKGCYFTYGARTNFRHLIYPVPEPGGLGTHLTLDLAGQARFGPDVEWVDDLNYDVSESRRETFAAAVRQFWPGVDPDQLQPAYAGIRPKLSGPGEPNVDFLLSGPADHQLDGIINLFGIESPGLTSSLALAERVHAIWEASR
jgi:L-2-hydroxyglutarate oxidase LhgO